jgi:hypothetical protein
MKRKTMVLLLAVLAAAATVTASYAVCYAYVSEQQCVKVGDCYSQCTPSGCSQTTCMMATQSGFEFYQMNTGPVTSGGTYKTRVWDSYTYNNCYVGACKVFNNCTYSYEFSPIRGCSCDFAVKYYTPGASGCP